MSILEGVGMYPRESRGRVQLQECPGWSREALSLQFTAAQDAAASESQLLVHNENCQVEGGSSLQQCGAAAAANEGLLPGATAHILGRRRERLRRG